MFSGILVPDQHEAEARVQPASLEPLCWGFLMNESNRKKEAIRTFVPAQEEIKFLGLWPRTRTRHLSLLVGLRNEPQALCTCSVTEPHQP